MELAQETKSEAQEQSAPVSISNIPDELHLNALFTVIHCGANSRIYLSESMTFTMISSVDEQLNLVDAVAGLLAHTRDNLLARKLKLENKGKE